MNVQDQIRDWFQKRGGGGLVLPSGWFGRPYDNVHQVSEIRVHDEALVLALDEGQLMLRFDGIPEIRADSEELTFTNFRSLDFDWKEYGSGKLHSNHFKTGTAKIMALPGL